MKKLLSATLIIILVITMCSTCVLCTSAASNFGVKYPTKNDIIKKMNELDIDLSGGDGYSSGYSLDPSGFALGAMDIASQKKALNFINFYRYIAGIPYDVTLNSEYSEYAQAASLINAANGYLSHKPPQPSGMSSSLYEECYKSAGRSNLAMGFDNIREATIFGWMDESYSDNIDRVGHRRWILNPYMKETGFGKVEDFYSMYSFDDSREGSFTGDYVAWPAPNTPLEMFSGSVFSVNLGDAYNDPSIDRVKVKISSKTLDQTWSISKNSGYDLYVNNDNYGMSKCIIFKVADFTDEDTLNVTISGIYKDGKESPIQYTVNLFALSEITADRTTIVMKPKTIAETGVTARSDLMSEEPYIDWGFDADGAAFITTEDQIFANKVGRCQITASILNDIMSVTLDVIVKDSEFLLGDADGDDKVSVTDVTMIQLYLAGMSSDNYCDYDCDVNGDGVQDILDVTSIQRYLAGRSTPYGVGESQL